MNLRPQQKKTPWHTAIRTVAMALLLLACADLAFPQICGEDNEPLFPPHGPSMASGHADDSGEPQPKPMLTEDCFCCCSHIVSEESASPLGALALVNVSAGIPSQSLTLPPVELLFHPPRLA